jgi:histidine triad (HIT) family protein
MDCLFCKILNGEIPSNKYFENDSVYAFADIHPQAPVHILVIHKIHTENISSTPDDQTYIFSDIFNAIKTIAEQEKLNEKGYRVIFNNGKAAGQVVYHMHAHILGGAESLGPMLAK